MISFLKKTALLVVCAICALPSLAVVNDVALKNIVPNAGELDTELRTLGQITLTFNMDVNVKDNTLAYLETPDGETHTSLMERTKYMKNVVLLNFPDIIYYTGTYTLTIKKWSVGDDEWLEDYEQGHSNHEIKVEWTIADGLSLDVDYDLEPKEILPANETPFVYPTKPLSLVQVTMPAGTIMNAQTEVILSCVEARYGQNITFEAENKGNTIVYTANVSPAPSIRGDYTMGLPAGMFGDSDFFSNGKGHANPPISLLYPVTPASEDETGDDEGVNWTITPSRVKLEGENGNYTLTWHWSSEIMTDKASLSQWRLLDNKGYRVPDVNFSFVNEGNPTEGVRFSANLSMADNYILLIPEGSYYDRIFVDSNHTSGSANAQLRYDFVPSDFESGVKSVSLSDNEAVCSVYTSQGFRLYDNATEDQLRNLAPGLYIIAGKKVLVK